MKRVHVSWCVYQLLVLSSDISKLYCKENGCFFAGSSGIESFCCDNFEYKNGKCIECKDGYIAAGYSESCEPCSEETYGRKCSYNCNCLKNELCDHIEGCVFKKQTTRTLTDTFESTSNKKEESAVTLPVLDNRVNESGMKVSELTALLVGSGGTLILCVALALFIYHKRKFIIRRVPIFNCSSLENNFQEDLYDEIDEVAMHNCDISVDNSATNRQRQANDDYLTPCFVDSKT